MTRAFEAPAASHLRINGAGPIKCRARSTKAEVEERRAAFLQIIEAQQPMTVRQVFYRATVLGLVEKTEGGYARVQNDLVLMRSGELPYGWLTDSTRYQRKPRSVRKCR